MAREELGSPLRGRIERIESLASLPVSFDRILGLALDAGTKVDDLARAIEADPVITARVLRLANSAYFGFRRRVEAIGEAVVVVGFRSVRNLAACVAVAPVFAREDGLLDRVALWRHSCGVAEASRLIAVHQSADDGAAYVCGLLHDVGQLVLSELLGGPYADAARGAAREGRCLEEVERDAFGVDHGWAGGVLAERWSLSERLVRAIRWHHTPEKDGEGAAARVALAEWLVGREGFGVPSEPQPDEPDRGLLRLLRLHGDDLDRLADAVRARRESIDLLFRESRGAQS